MMSHDELPKGKAQAVRSKKNGVCHFFQNRSIKSRDHAVRGQQVLNPKEAMQIPPPPIIYSFIVVHFHSRKVVDLVLVA